MAERPLYTLYKNLKAQNYDVPDDYNKFESALTRDGKGGADNRHAIYENLKAQNFDVPSTYERFYSALFEPRSKTSSRAKGGSVPMSAADRARFSAGAAAISASAQQTMNNAGRYNRLKQRKQKQQKDFGRVNLGTHQTPYGGDANNVVKDDFAYNPETGKAGAYVTSDNENVYSLPEAEQMQAILDKQNDAYQVAVDTGEIPSAFDVRDKNGNYDLQENIGKNGTYLTEEGAQKQFDKKLADAYARKKEIEALIAEDNRQHGNPLLSYGASIGAGNGRTAEQSDYRNKLATSLSLVTEQIGALEAVKQYPTSSWGEDALKALDNTAFTAKTWDFGLTYFAIMGQMERIKTKMDNNIPLSGSDKMLLKSKLGADAATALEDEKMGNVYRWTKIAGQSLPFMADFFLTGGYGGITKGISRGALKFAAKRGMGKMGAAILKNTGIVAGDVIGSYAMAGTEQALKTGADIMQRHLGNLYQDEKGDYKFGTFDENGNLLHEGGESIGTALYKGMTSAMVENYTEKLFGHNYGIKKGAVNFMEKHGMNASAEFFKNIGKSGWYTNSKKWMEKFGINGFAEEVMEEEIGIPLHALLDGEGKVSDLLDAKQQLDIIGGMAISVGSMYAMGAGSRPVKGIYNRAQYYRFRNKVNVADSDAQNLMGDNWADIKDKIDNATNEQMGGVLADILRQRDTMTKEQINAAVNYGVNLMKMRGYNIAKTAEMNAKEITNEPTTPEEQHQADIDNAYSEGHDADDADKHDIQIQQEDQMKTLAAALGISEQQLSAMSDEELESLTGQDDKLDQAIYDYQLSSARYQGVVDDAQDKVDLAAHQAEQRVDMYTDQSRGSVRNATIKASGGLEDYGVYIISGNVATHEDGSIDVSNSDDMILYYDPTTNSVEHADALMFAELGEELPADDVKAQAVSDAKENAIKEVAGIIDGTVEVGSQFNVTDTDGTEHTYEVLADYGDGTAAISIDGNVVENPYSLADLQQMKDLEDQKRLEAAKAEREQMEKERAAQQTQETEETQPSFDFNQILNDNGNVVLVDVLDKDGNTKYPDSRLFLIRDAGAKAKVVELKSDGTIVPHAVSKEDVATISSMSLDEYKQAMPESSMIEDNSGEESDEDSQLENLGLPKGSEIWMSGDGFGRPKENTLSKVVGIDEQGSIILEDKDGKKWSASFDYINNHRELPPLDENTNIVNEENNQSESNAEENTPATEQTPAITLEDGTIVPMLEDGNPDFSKLTAAQTAELYDTQFGEDADSIVSGYVSDAKKALDKASNMTVKGKTFVEQKAAKDAKEKAIADAQAAYDSAIAIRDAYNERQLAKVEDTAEGRKELIEKARRKFARLKSAVKDDAEAVSQLYRETIGSLLHRLYDSTGIDVTDTTPLTAEEYVASNLGAHSLNYEGTETSKGVKQETGLSREDFAKTQLLAADGKGTTIDALVHSLWENRPSNLESLDTQDIRNALIGVLNSGFKASEARNFVENIRIAQAENILEEQKRAQENAAYAEHPEAEPEAELKAKSDEKAELKAKSEAKLDNESSNESNDLDNEKTNDKINDNISVPEDATDENPLGAERDESDLPFSAKENGKQQTTAERAADVEKNKVDDMKVVDNIIGQNTRKAFERLAKMMGANIQWQYSDKLGNGWIQETTDADGKVHRTIFITLDSSITEGAQFIFGHEMTHQIKNLNPAAYNELTQLVLDTYGSDAFDKAVDETMQRYSDAGFSGRARDYYAEEVVADSVGEMIRDLNLAHTLAMKMSHPLLATIHEILQKIKLAFFGTEYSDVTKNIIRSIEQAYVKTAKGEVTNSETGEDVSFSLRQKPEPKKKGVGYKVFVLKDGKLYPPMVANPDGAATPVGVWLDADAAPIAGESKTGRPQVKQGGKGTQGGSGKLAYRPGWHLGVVPYAIQFNRKDAEGNKTLFPKNFVFAEVEYAADVDYQEEARQEGINPSGKYQHSLAGLKHLPTDGYYMYRTNPNPETDPWVITGAMKVNRILTRAEQADLVSKAGREPQQIQEGDIVTDDVVNSINQEIADAPKFSLKDIKPVGVGAFGNIYNQFRGNAKAAIEFLKKVRGGEAVGALHHKDIGDIDLVWGKEGTGHSDGYGLSKLVKYHPEVLDNLQEILNDMRVVSSSKNRVNLESETHKAGVRLTWDGERKSWLLTAFKKETSASDKRTDTAATSLEGDTALSQTEGSAAKIDNSSETTKENGEKFSLKDEKTLVGVHNISEEKLLKAIKQGGLANPSVAVIDSSRQDHKAYGGISLIMPSDKIAKRTGKNAGTWQNDAYTPTYPQVERQMSNKGAEKASKDVSSVPSDMYSEVRRGLDRWLDGGEANSAMAYMFLHEKGVAPEPKKIQPKFSDEAYNELKFITAGDFNIYGIGKADAQKVLDMYIEAKFDGDKALYEEKTKAWLERNKAIVDAGTKGGMRYAIAKENVELYDEYGFNYKGVQSFVRDVEYDHRKTGVDTDATLNEVENYIKTNNLTDEFNTWLEGKEKEYGIKEVIFDGFTPSGNRRYVPNTLENVSKLMKKQGRNGATGAAVSFQNFAARLMPSYGTLKDIRSKKGLLTSDREKFDKFRDKWSNVFFELGNKCQPDSTSAFDSYGMERLSEAAMTSDPQAYLKKEYNVDFSDEDTKRLKEMVKAIKEEHPAMYFETKFERPVRFDEFSAAVVPTTTKKEVKEALKNAGVSIFEYDEKSDADRKRAFNEAINSSDNIRFSLKSMMAKPEGWKQANKKAIHIAEAIERDPKFSLKNLDGTLIKAGTYFSGGGLVEEGLKGIIDPVVAVEYDEKISGVYRNNFGQHIVTADVRDVDPKELVKQIDGEVEYFHASPVCKNYSQAKSNHAEVELDKETAASTAEFINSVKPKVVTIENVKGYKDSDAMKIITDALDANGYTWDADVYNAADYGGYTNRERLIVRAVRDGKLPEKPKKMARKSGWYEAVADIIPTLTEKKNGVAPWMDIRLKADGIDWRNIDKPLYVMGSAYADGKVPHAFADELLPTLRTKSGDVIVMPDGKVYRAMGRVLARVSGVSDDYKMPFSENLSHTIIGNGIPTQLTEHVIAPLLTGSDPKFSIRTYHGSGASFDKFNLSHALEGEGSETFGHGVYVTNSKKIGDNYAQRAKDRKGKFGFDYKIDMSADAGQMLSNYINKNQDVDKGLENARQDLKSALEMFPDDETLKELSAILQKNNNEIAEASNEAYLYDVDIPDDNGENYLGWNESQNFPLEKWYRLWEITHHGFNENEYFKDGGANYDKDRIERIIQMKLDSPENGMQKLPTLKGEELYHALEDFFDRERPLRGAKLASRALSEIGFVGIKYPAGMIHGGAKEGDYNYVIFDENNANIVGNTRFSLRYDKFEHDLNQWKKDNNLPKDAQRPTIPQRNVGESAVDFLRRVDEYRKQMALWKTAPTYEQHLLSDDTALGEFNRELQKGSVLKRIAFQDSMLAIRKAQEAIMKEVGVDRLNMAEDAYTAENRSHGKGKNEFEEYNNEFLQPLRKAYHQMRKVLGDSYDNVRIYMMAKHGLERDAQMAFKKSLDADFEDVAQRSAAYRAYKGDMNRITNDSDLEFGRVDFTTWRQRDNALRTKYSPSYMDYRYDKNGIAYDYSGLSALFGGSDFEETAYKLVKDIEDKYVTETHNLWDATNAATKKILRDGYKAGMMSKDTYQYVRDMYSHYIPLRGWDGTTADQVWDYIGGGKGAFNQTLKKANGRTSIADDPIAYIENMAESGILLNNKNWVKQHLMLLAQNHPTSLLTLSKAWYVKSVDDNGNEEWIPATPQITSQMDSNQVKAAIDAFEKKMEKMAQTGDATQKRDGLNIAYPQTHSEEREHEVRVMKDGEEYVIYVNGDPQLAQAMNNTRAHRVREIQSGKLDRAAAWLGRKMAAAYTSLSPLFIPSNYFRDLTMTLASTAIREDAKYNYLLRKNLATSWNLGFMLRDYQNGKLRDKVNNGNATPKEQMFYDFMMNGGETGFVSSLDVEDLKKKFKNDLKDLDRWKTNPVKVGHTIMDGIEFLNRAIEDSNRFAVYMTSIQYGRSIDEAVNDAKDVTLNFNRKGTGEYGWQMIRNLYLFINPAVQSLQTLGALVKHHPFKFTAVTASWLASGVLVPIVNAALMSLLGGDDDKDKYWQFTKWDRRNNLIMWVPFTHEYIKIPLAQEFRAFYGIGDMIASKMIGGELAEASWSQYAEDLLGQVVDMLPLDPTGYDGNIAVSLMPNAIRPVFELAFNVDFTGKPLFKETEYNKYDPNFTKAYVGTPDWLVRISRMVNSIGNDYPDVQQNSIDAFGDPKYNLNNPAVVDHVLSSYLGGAYTMGSQVLGLLTKSLNDRKEIKVADIPLFSKFVSNPDDRPVSKKQGDEFWDKKEYYDRASNTISKLKKQAKIDGDYSLLERFYGSEEYKTYKLYEKDVKDYKEARKKERAEESGDEYRPHQLNAEDIYNNHATPMDEFEDMKLKQLFEKLNSFKTRYDAIVDNAPNESDGYYNTNKAAIDAIDEISLDKQEISELKKGFLDDGKDAYNAEDMKQIRELRKKILAVLEKANKVVVANQKTKAEK
jgi:site-specific DNA-cytosine methylase|uniref:Cytosine specific methyltransferase n=1 Tax=Podoviridae sp. ctKmJ5 TaxID=2827732 RepID=A0A8S5SZK1_9CAUD|nr:MAG TPA: Cytosine specific methyltransferase [Podoviridae sp. ctKmJ5]